MTASLRRTLIIALVSYAALLVIVLANPSPAVGNGAIDRVASLAQLLHVPASVASEGRIEFGLNVLAFMPLSLLGSLLRPAVPVSAWVAVGFGGSLLVEALQGGLPERTASHADIVANTLGAALGAMAAWAVTRGSRQ